MGHSSIDGGVPQPASAAGKAAPKTAKCGDKPIGIVNISGRGSFKAASLRDYDASDDYWWEPTRIGSGFHAIWRFDADAFVDAEGCSCCSKVGFVQVRDESVLLPNAMGTANQLAGRRWSLRR